MASTEDNKERLERLEDKLDKHMTEYQERQIRQDVAHAQNMEAISELTRATKDIVDAWSAVIAVQRFLKWVSAFAIVAVAYNWVASLPLIRLFTTKGG